MARNNGTPGAGRQAGRGLKGIAQREYQDAINSVPKLKFDRTGTAVVENPTDQQRKGLRYLAAKPDMKVLAETGEEREVWDLVDHGDRIEVIHLRYRAKHDAIEASKQRIALVGRLSFHRGLADYLPESDEHEQGLLELIAEQNRLAAKYDRAEWHYRKSSDGRYFISKRVVAAS